MKKDKAGRSWRSAGVWQQIVERYERRTVSADEFCRREGIASSSLWKWRKRFSKSSTELRPGSFVEIQPRLVEQGSSAVELRFPNGMMLRVLGV